MERQTYAHYRDRAAMIEALHRRYGGGLAQWRLWMRFWRKKYTWLAVITFSRILKRSLDVIVAATALLLLSPLLALVALAIRATDGGPVLFWQVRVGKWGREFPFPKFRSMVVDAEAQKDRLLAQSHHVDSITFKMKRDPRVTWIGRIIRKLSIDELPQLWCVLRGDMSLVGPRPPVPREVASYNLTDRRRLDVVPGLTSLWAVRGRGDIPFERQLALDVEYIESQSFWADLKILLQTVPAVLLGRGAY
jgi:lipopolysaccharide/colanic/teichoic acid biosynthesis glycosyltransferase